MCARSEDKSCQLVTWYLGRRSRSSRNSRNGGAEVVEFTVSEGADVAGLTIEDAVEGGLLADEMLVVGIEREGDVLPPNGETRIQTGDVVSLFSKSSIEKDALDVFGSQ